MTMQNPDVENLRNSMYRAAALLAATISCADAGWFFQGGRYHPADQMEKIKNRADVFERWLHDR
jgi:hypothetical protein